MAFDLPAPIADIHFLIPPAAIVFDYPWRSQPSAVALYEMPDGRGAMRADLTEAKAKVEGFAAMPENWDGYGAIQIGLETKKNAQSALELILIHAPAPDITPNSNGTISLEWETPHGVSHLEIGRTKFSFYITARSGPPVLADGNVDQITSDFGKLLALWLLPTRHGGDTMTEITYPIFDLGHV